GFGVRQTHGSRTHVVLAPGSYTLAAGPLSLSSQLTTATSLSIHGGGATLTGGSGDGFIDVHLPTTLRDLEIVNPTPSEGSTIRASTTMLLERTRIRGHNGISNFGQ